MPRVRIIIYVVSSAALLFFVRRFVKTFELIYIFHNKIILIMLRKNEVQKINSIKENFIMSV